MPTKRFKPQHRVTKRVFKPAPKTTTAKPQPQTRVDSPNSPVYFWRETEPSTGYLSQWYPCAFSDDANPSIVYQTAEHYMMYHKAMLFSDPSVAAQILSSSHPRKVRALGRKVSNFADVVWNAHREAIVRRGNMLKFTRPVDATRDGRWIVPLEVERKDGTVTEERSLRELLLGTGEEELVEASPFDRIWGIGYGADKASKVQRERWGMNLLGKALMAVRAELRKELAEGESGTGAVDEKKTDVSEGTKEGKESG